MQKLDGPQTEAVLDVIDQCKVVSQAHERLQRESAGEEAAEVQKDEAVPTTAQRMYKGALATLSDTYLFAAHFGVQESILDGTLERNLPAEVYQSMQQTTAA